MIALRDGMPLIEFGGGNVRSFEHGWLVRALVKAAGKAGYPQWWLAEHVAESVSAYLREHCPETVVAVPRLSRAVQSALQVIGYSEVAQCFEPGPPPVRISLLELAQEAGAGYELAFFAQLGDAVKAGLAARAVYFEAFAIEKAVKRLRARKVWSRDCEHLRDEIVEFLRRQISTARCPEEILFSVS